MEEGEFQPAESGACESEWTSWSGLVSSKSSPVRTIPRREATVRSRPVNRPRSASARIRFNRNLPAAPVVTTGAATTASPARNPNTERDRFTMLISEGRAAGASWRFLTIRRNPRTRRSEPIEGFTRSPQQKRTRLDSSRHHGIPGPRPSLLLIEALGPIRPGTIELDWRHERTRAVARTNSGRGTNELDASTNELDASTNELGPWRERTRRQHKRTRAVARTNSTPAQTNSTPAQTNSTPAQTNSTPAQTNSGRGTNELRSSREQTPCGPGWPRLQIRRRVPGLGGLVNLSGVEVRNGSTTRLHHVLPLDRRGGRFSECQGRLSVRRAPTFPPRFRRRFCGTLSAFGNP